MEIIPGRIYQHFKGGRYRVVLLARDSADPERTIVIYSTLGLDVPPTIWARNSSEWNDMVRNKEGSLVRRFELEPEPDGEVPDLLG